MAEHPGVPALVGLVTGAFGVFAHVSFIVARLLVCGGERFSFVTGQYFPAVGQSEPTDGPLLAGVVM